MLTYLQYGSSTSCPSGVGGSGNAEASWFFLVRVMLWVSFSIDTVGWVTWRASVLWQLFPKGSVLEQKRIKGKGDSQLTQVHQENGCLNGPCVMMVMIMMMSVYVQRMGEDVRCADDWRTAVLQRPEACEGCECLLWSVTTQVSQHLTKTQHGLSKNKLTTTRPWLLDKILAGKEQFNSWQRE